MTNEWISDRLRALKKTKGSLAKALGVDPARVSEIIGGRRNVQVSEIPIMAEMLEMGTGELLARLVPRGGRPQDRPFVTSLAETPAPAPLPPPMFVADLSPHGLGDPSNAAPRTLPVLGCGLSRSDGGFELTGAVVDMVDRPGALIGARTGYGLFVQSDTMEPRFEPGWLLYIHPGRPVRRGDNVVIKVRGRDEHHPALAYIAVLENRGPSHVEVRQFQPAQTLRWPNEDVVSIHRVIGVGEL